LVSRPKQGAATDRATAANVLDNEVDIAKVQE
jgi:hypothetical protein